MNNEMVREIPKQEIDFLNYINKQEEEWDLIRDLQQENIEENCYRLVITDLRTGKKILNLITDQITMDQNFDFDLQQDIMTLKILLSDEYVEENGDKDYLEDLEPIEHEGEEWILNGM